jgi:hypothetical protein
MSGLKKVSMNSNGKRWAWTELKRELTVVKTKKAKTKSTEKGRR